MRDTSRAWCHSRQTVPCARCTESPHDRTITGCRAHDSGMLATLPVASESVQCMQPGPHSRTYAAGVAAAVRIVRHVGTGRVGAGGSAAAAAGVDRHRIRRARTEVAVRVTGAGEVCEKHTGRFPRRAGSSPAGSAETFDVVMSLCSCMTSGAASAPPISRVHLALSSAKGRAAVPRTWRGLLQQLPAPASPQPVEARRSGRLRGAGAGEPAPARRRRARGGGRGRGRRVVRVQHQFAVRQPERQRVAGQDEGRDALRRVQWVMSQGRAPVSPQWASSQHHLMSSPAARAVICLFSKKQREAMCVSSGS